MNNIVVHVEVQYDKMEKVHQYGVVVEGEKTKIFQEENVEVDNSNQCIIMAINRALKFLVKAEVESKMIIIVGNNNYFNNLNWLEKWASAKWNKSDGNKVANAHLWSKVWKAKKKLEKNKNIVAVSYYEGYNIKRFLKDKD